MHQRLRRTLGVVIVLAVAWSAGTGEARAQYYPGYGGYGWGGWSGGATTQGNIAQGLGMYNIGAGVYNLDSAQANSINADTIMRWNEYMFLAQQEANRREYLRRARMLKRDAHSGEEIYKRVRDNPTERDIQDGDALNAVLDQITNPKIHSTALRMIKTPIPGEVVREIPFQNASEGVTISLHQLTGEGNWPLALQGEAFAPERKAYQEAIARAVKEDEEGKLSAQSLQDVNRAASRLRAKFEANRPADKVQAAEAANYIRGLLGMARMLEQPQVDKILAELDMVKETTLGSLLGFMHTYNLRFGPATTDAQRAVYESLYPMLDEARDKILKDLGDTGTGNAPVARDNPGRPTDFFQGMHLDHLERRSGGDSTNATKP